jgi:hypothetical protein
MDLVRQQITQLQDTHGTESPSLTFTAGGLQAVRPEEENAEVRRLGGGGGGERRLAGNSRNMVDVQITA